MDRRREDRRPARDDNRNHKPRYEQDRSRSPPRRDRRDDRRRDRSPARERGGPPSRPSHDRDRDFHRPRDSGPPQRGRPNGDNRPAPRDSKLTGGLATPTPRAVGKDSDTRMQLDGKAEDEDSEAEMQRVMGFKDFRTTKNSKVPGNDRNYGVWKNKKSEYRQYMNRKGGFNRPLSPSRK